MHCARHGAFLFAVQTLKYQFP